MGLGFPIAKTTVFGSDVPSTHLFFKKAKSQKMIKRVSSSVKYKFSLVKTTQDEECMKAAEKKRKKKPRHISLADKTPHPLGTL